MAIRDVVRSMNAYNLHIATALEVFLFNLSLSLRRLRTDFPKASGFLSVNIPKSFVTIESPPNQVKQP